MVHVEHPSTVAETRQKPQLYGLKDYESLVTAFQQIVTFVFIDFNMTPGRRIGNIMALKMMTHQKGKYRTRGRIEFFAALNGLNKFHVIFGTIKMFR